MNISFGQQLNLNQNTHFNIFNENIAFAGNYEATHFSLDYHQLWNIQGAPESFKFSAHTPLRADKMGIGILAQRTSIGAHEEIAFKVAFAYKIPIKSGRIAFGLGAGFVQYNFKFDDLQPLDPEDQLLGFSGLNSTVIDFDFSTLYTDNRSFLGFEINQLTSSKWNLNETDSSTQIPHFKLAGGHVFPLKNQDFIRISAHARTDLNFKLQTDVMASYFYQKKIWFGAGIRLNYGLLATLEINFTKRLQAGYIVGIPLFDPVKSFSPSHSVFLGYMLPTDKTRASSVRNF